MRCVVFDVLSYEDLKRRLIQNGCIEDAVEVAIPRNNFFQLQSPFDEDFGWDHTGNVRWVNRLGDPSARRASMDQYGSGGVPIIGAIKAEYSRIDIEDFLSRHVQELTRVSAGAMSLQAGVLACILTTLRGATGTGAAPRIGAALKSVMNGGEVHARISMPCVWGTDPHVFANAYAFLQETLDSHRLGGVIPDWEGSHKAGPFDMVTYTFNTNGIQSLVERDVAQSKVAALQAYLRPSTQSAIFTRRVDLDVPEYDHEGKSTHLATETALTLSVLPPGLVAFELAEWTAQAHAAIQKRFDEYVRSGALTPEEQLEVEQVCQQVVAECGFSAEPLTGLLDGAGSVVQGVRGLLETARVKLDQTPQRQWAGLLKNLGARIHEMFSTAERKAWPETASDLGRRLPQALAERIRVRTEARPELELAALEKMESVAADVNAALARRESQAQTQRAEAGTRFERAAKGPESGGWLGLGNAKAWAQKRDEALTGAFDATLARSAQMKCEILKRCLFGGDPADALFHETAPGGPILEELRKSKVARKSQTLFALACRGPEIENARSGAEAFLRKTSPVFQAALLDPDATVESLSMRVLEARGRHSGLKIVGQYCLDPAMRREDMAAELQRYLPSYDNSCLSLYAAVRMNPASLSRAVQLLRDARPFTPVKKDVEDMYETRNRRDQLTVLELPGGKSGPIAALLASAGIIEDFNQVVESGCEEIRFYQLRRGVPYPALRQLDRYRERFESYLDAESGVKTYTGSQNNSLPLISLPEMAVRDYAHRLVTVSQFVAPGLWVLTPSREYQLRLPDDPPVGFRTLDELKRYIAKSHKVREKLQALVKAALDRSPAAYLKALEDGLRKAPEEHRTILQQEINRYSAAKGRARRVLPMPPSPVPPRPRGRGRRAAAGGGRRGV